jgi:hypothetical protein
MIELAWGHLTHQKSSPQSAWYRMRIADARGGTRKTIVALAPVKGKSQRDDLRPPLTVTARSVRRKIRSGRGDGARQSNKEMTGHDGLDTNRPIQVRAHMSGPSAKQADSGWDLH